MIWAVVGLVSLAIIIFLVVLFVHFVAQKQRELQAAIDHADNPGGFVLSGTGTTAPGSEHSTDPTGSPAPSPVPPSPPKSPYVGKEGYNPNSPDGRYHHPYEGTFPNPAYVGKCKCENVARVDADGHPISGSGCGTQECPVFCKPPCL